MIFTAFRADLPKKISLERWKKGTNPKYFMGRKRRGIERVRWRYSLVSICTLYGSPPSHELVSELCQGRQHLSLGHVLPNGHLQAKHFKQTSQILHVNLVALPRIVRGWSREVLITRNKNNCIPISSPSLSMGLSKIWDFSCKISVLV